MIPGFHHQAERQQGTASIERRLLLLVASVGALIAGAVLSMTELMRDPATGGWLGDGLDRLALLFSVCR